MVTHYEQLDDRLEKLRPFAKTQRPASGWARAIRNAIGMTTTQLAQRIGVSQPRVVALEKAEVDGSITLDSLDRAARALDCRLVYVFIPNTSLAEMLNGRAGKIADRRLASIDHTMRLEAQGVSKRKDREDTRQRLVEGLLRRPARLWDVA